jgi:hypothetical protein
MPNPTILSATDSARAIIARSTARQRRRRAVATAAAAAGDAKPDHPKAGRNLATAGGH